MTRLELLTLLYSLQAPLESDNVDKAREEIEKTLKKQKTQTNQETKRGAE